MTDADTRRGDSDERLVTGPHDRRPAVDMRDIGIAQRFVDMDDQAVADRGLGHGPTVDAAGTVPPMPDASRHSTNHRP